MNNMEKIEIFKLNLTEAGFTEEFVNQALNYFNETEKESRVQVLSLEDILGYLSSFTCNALQSEINLINLRKDLYKLYQYDTNNILDLNYYFYNIEEFELQVLYVLYYEFYPQEEEEEEEEEN